MRPRRRSAASSASVSVVLPLPDAGAAMTSPGVLFPATLVLRGWSEPAIIVRVVKCAVGKIARGERWPDQDQRRAFDRFSAHLGAARRQRGANDDLLRPARAHHHGDSAVGATMRDQRR